MRISILALVLISSTTGQELSSMTNQPVPYDNTGDEYKDYDDDYPDNNAVYAYDNTDQDLEEDYDETEYQYTDEDYAYEEYQKPDENVIVPTFTSESTRVLVDRGNTARLRCSADNLGEHIIFWKKIEEVGPRVLSIGNLTMVEDARLSVTIEEGSSTLYLALVEADDIGVYICEISTSPALIQEHRIEIRSPASVLITNYLESIIIDQGDSLELQCKGFGDPLPAIYWYRENTHLPDGNNKIQGERLYYSSVTGKHSGVYTCSGDNGFGTPSTQSVMVNVRYSPDVILYHELKQNQDLQLNCVVKSYPEATVAWSRNDGALPERAEILDEGGKHILRIAATSQKDIGVYKCSAENSIGNSDASIDLSGNENLMNTITQVVSDSSTSILDTVKSVDELLELDPPGRAGTLQTSQDSELELDSSLPASLEHNSSNSHLGHMPFFIIFSISSYIYF